jgi:branched-chain amino acid transport system permease protein
VTQVLQYTVDSISYGSLFALMSLSLALLFGVMRLMNFAYGELIMAGAYTMYYTRGYGWLAMIAITVVAVTALSLLMERVAFRPVRNASPVTLLITSFAVSYGLQWLGFMTVGQGPPKGVAPYPVLTKQFDVGGVLVSRLAILTAVVVIVLVIALTLLLKRTMLGIQLRASSEDFRMAQLVGVRANWVIMSAFAITGLLASAVAVLFIFRNGAVSPTIGQEPLLIAFVGGVIGGLGSLTGAALGGFFLGALINALQAALPVELSSHTRLFAFAAVIAILVFQPNGLVSIRGRLLVRWWRRLRPVAVGQESA